MHLIVPLDESERSLLALPIARLLAQHREAEVTLVTVLPGLAMPGKTRELAEFLQAVAVEEREVSGLNVHSTVRVGDPASEILQLAWEAEADLIVMSTRARRGAERALLGSVADQVLHSAGIPVVVLHPNGREIKRLKTIVVPLDGTPGAAVALTSAVPLAQSSLANLMLVQVADQDAQRAVDTYIEDVAAQLRAAGVQAEGRHAAGKPPTAILSVAEEVDADLIVMSTHARGGVVRSVLGSVADEVVLRSHRPVLLVRRDVVDPPTPDWWVIEPRMTGTTTP